MEVELETIESHNHNSFDSDDSPPSSIDNDNDNDNFEDKLDDIDIDIENIDENIEENIIVSKYDWVESKKYWYGLFHVLLVIFGITTIILIGISSPGLWKLFNHETVCDSSNNSDNLLNIPSNAFSFSDMFNISPKYPIIYWIKPINDYDSWISKEITKSGLIELVKYSYSEDIITNSNKIDIEPESSIYYSSDLYPQDSDIFIISPNGEYILFGYDLKPIYRHSYYARWQICESTLHYCVDLTNSNTPDIQYIQWSDNNRISYVRDNNLYIITQVSNNIQNNTIQVTYDGEYTHIINGLSDWAYEEEIFESAKANYWSPNSDYISFIKFQQNPIPNYNFSIYHNNASYPELYEYKYPCSGENNSIVSLWIYDISNNITYNIPLPDDNSQYLTSLQWINDNEFAFQVLDHIQHEQNLYIYSLNTQESTLIRTQYDSRWIDPFYKFYSIHNGEHFIVMEAKNGYKHFILIDRYGDIIKDLNEHEEFDVENMLSFDENRNIFYYSSHQPSPSDLNIFSISLDDYTINQLTNGDKVYSSASFSPSSSYYALYSYGIDIPTVSMVSTYSYPNPLTIIEDNNKFSCDINDKAMPTREYFEIPIDSGESLNSMMYLPPNFNEDNIYPVLLYVYGGPDSQTVNYEYELGFWYFHSFLASSMNIIVVSVDNRGTCCKGQDFLKQTYLHLGDLEVNDQIAAMNYLSTLSYIDSNKIAIWGWSYGAYMSANVLSTGESIVRGAISVSPVTDWRFYDSIYTERYMQTPLSNDIGYASSSVLGKAKNIHKSSSYLLIHGTADDNVHFQNSADWVTTLVNEDVNFDTMYYPDKAHSLSGITTRVHLWKKIIRFISNIFELPLPLMDSNNIESNQKNYNILSQHHKKSNKKIQF